jgi:quercetin dioxygenase-like cupin family protein
MHFTNTVRRRMCGATGSVTEFPKEQDMTLIKKILATAMLFGTFATTEALAAGCPANKVVAEGRGQPKSNAPASGVTDTIIATNAISKPPIGLKDRLFRMRRLVVESGGVVPWHNHSDRPAIIYIISGQITEYANTCAVPIVHVAGEAVAEMAPTSHWWKNTSAEPAVLISADLFHVAHEDEHMM